MAYFDTTKIDWWHNFNIKKCDDIEMVIEFLSHIDDVITQMEIKIKSADYASRTGEDDGQSASWYKSTQSALGFAKKGRKEGELRKAELNRQIADRRRIEDKALMERLCRALEIIGARL